MGEKEYLLAVNTAIISKPGKKPDFGTGIDKSLLTEWQNRTRSQLTFCMVNVSLPVSRIANIIRGGGTICAAHTGGQDCHHKPGEHNCTAKQHRCNANFLLGWFLGADFDYLDSEQEILDNPVVKEYASIIYHTPSSYTEKAEGKPRMRAIFLLDQPIADGAQYREMNLALQYKLAGLADRSTKDHCRLWFGNQGTKPIVTDKVLPVATAVNWHSEYLATLPPEEKPAPTRTFKPGQKLLPKDEYRRQKFAEGCIRHACDRIRAAAPGGKGLLGRHDTLVAYAVWVASFIEGGVITDRQAAYDALLDAYPMRERGDGPEAIKWAFDNCYYSQGMPEDEIKLNFSKPVTSGLNFSKPAVTLNFNR